MRCCLLLCGKTASSQFFSTGSKKNKKSGVLSGPKSPQKTPHVLCWKSFRCMRVTVRLGGIIMMMFPEGVIMMSYPEETLEIELQ